MCTLFNHPEQYTYGLHANFLIRHSADNLSKNYRLKIYESEGRKTVKLLVHTNTRKVI